MPDETTGFDPEAVSAVFGNEPEPTTLDLVPAGSEKPAESGTKLPESKTETPVSARIAAAKRAEAKAAQARGAVSAREQELQRRAESIAAAEKRNEERDAELRLMEEDPARYFEVKKLGTKGIQAHLERLANGLKPEEVQEKRQGALEVELERLKARDAERDEQIRAERKATEDKAISERVESEYLGHIEQNVEKYSALVEEFPTKEAAVKAGYELLNRVVATDAQGRKITELSAFLAKSGGEYPTNDQICTFLNDVAKERIAQRQNSVWRKQPEAGSSGSDGGSPSGSVTRSPTGTGKPRTLSARDTSSRATAPDAKWSQEWADEESLRILRGST